jgi:hypothetical protein
MPMKKHAESVLKLVLDKARRSHATQIRFISGMYPALVVETALRYLEMTDLKAETVRNIHEECLSMADWSEPAPGNGLNYTFTSPAFGRFVCEYRILGNTTSLTLLPEQDATETVVRHHPVVRPALSNEADVNDGVPENKGRRTDV